MTTVVAWIAAALVAAQAATPAFEVASVKPSAARDTAMRIIWPRGRFSAANVTTRQFIEAAYMLPPFRLEGGPGWVGADRFYVEATVPADAVSTPARGMPEAIRLMMQRLLADRFRFVAHWEKKTQTTYSLVVAGTGRPSGQNFHRSSVDCAALFASRQPGGPLPPVAQCGVQRSTGRLVLGGYSTAQLSDTLQSLLQQTVVDRTGLSGAFDVELTWSPDPASDAGPSLFTAVQEQLGLKLDASKGPVDVLVIDRVEKPSAD